MAKYVFKNSSLKILVKWRDVHRDMIISSPVKENVVDIADICVNIDGSKWNKITKNDDEMMIYIS